MKILRRMSVQMRLLRGIVPLIFRIFRVEPRLVFPGSEFKRIYLEIKPRTLVGKPRCLWLWRLVKFAAKNRGDIAEIGVYKGGTARLLARSCPQKTVYLFDTFSGMPDVDPEIDAHRAGEFADTSLESVQDFLKDAPNVSFRQGFFPDTAAGLEDHVFCFVNIDVDIYSSTKSCLEFFYPRMVPGGVISFDDYKWKKCAGVKKAIDEFLVGKPEKVIEMEEFQCAIIKT